MKYPEASTVENPINPDVAEAAGLAHDLGHPPFGHIAEEELDSLVRAKGLADGYEGNAQSFRIVARLASSDATTIDGEPVDGLNLSRATLNGLLKYPWNAASDKGKQKHKWGHYESERDIFNWTRQGSQIERRSLIAEIMDWADDITFAIHDLLDFFAAGLIPIDRCKPCEQSVECESLLQGILSRKGTQLGPENQVAASLYSIVDLFPFAPDQPFKGSRQDYIALHGFGTSLITSYVNSIRLVQQSGQWIVDIDPGARRLVEVLKQFTWQYVIFNPDLGSKQIGQRKAIRVVFKELLAAAEEGKLYLFPPLLRKDLKLGLDDPYTRVRITSDCISGMTERELTTFYRRLEGLAD